MIFLGALDIDQGEFIALDIRLGADAATVQAAILKANAERAAAAKRESEHLQRRCHAGSGLATSLVAR